MQSNPIGHEISEEEVEKLEVTCGFCEKKIRIRSLTDHVKFEHSK